MKHQKFQYLMAMGFPRWKCRGRLRRNAKSKRRIQSKIGFSILFETRCLAKLRKMVTAMSKDSEISQFHVESLFSRKEFCETLFSLFDHKDAGYLVQNVWFSNLKICSLGLE